MSNIFQPSNSGGCGDQHIDIRIVVPIDNRQAGDENVGGREHRTGGDLFERQIPAIRKEPQACGCRNDQVEVAIVIKVCNGSGLNITHFIKRGTPRPGHERASLGFGLFAVLDQFQAGRAKQNEIRIGGMTQSLHKRFMTQRIRRLPHSRNGFELLIDIIIQITDDCTGIGTAGLDPCEGVPGRILSLMTPDRDEIRL